MDRGRGHILQPSRNDIRKHTPKGDRSVILVRLPPSQMLRIFFVPTGTRRIEKGPRTRLLHLGAGRASSHRPIDRFGVDCSHGRSFVQSGRDR